MNVPRGSRKDLRDAVRVARAAQPGWAGATAYNRGQILYRLSEMLDDRLETLPTSKEDATAAVATSSSLNPPSGPTSTATSPGGSVGSTSLSGLEPASLQLN